VDGADVSEADLGSNFFVEQSARGTSRAACVTRLLQELNEHVTGSYIADDILQARAAPGLRPWPLATASKAASSACHRARLTLLLIGNSCVPGHRPYLNGPRARARALL